MQAAHIVGTCDTKADELGYVRDLLAAAGVPTRLVDLSTSGRGAADVSADEVAACHPQGAGAIFGAPDRGAAVGAMAAAFEAWVATNADAIGGIIGLGGSGGTALVAPGMRALPVGVPKVLVSTVASGDVSAYVGPCDISLVYSVTDVAGLNPISRRVLGNAAHSLAGMMNHAGAVPQVASKPALGMTMFGVTTTCVRRCVDALEERYDCLVFHATGTGGQSLEKLVDSGMIEGVLDVTLTEVCDLHAGGIMSAGEGRLDAIARTRVPWVGSLGALDMVNFAGRETIPARYQGRKLHVHNPQITLMRTTADENAAMGEWVARKLNACAGPVRLLVPEGGVSAMDAPGQAFHDPEANAALFDAIERSLEVTAQRRLIRRPEHINDAAFADALVANLLEIL